MARQGQHMTVIALSSTRYSAHGSQCRTHLCWLLCAAAAGIEEAKKRDHRNVGVQQELFFFHPLSPGSCFFLPHGGRIYNTLMELMREKYWEYEYEEVRVCWGCACWGKNSSSSSSHSSRILG
jgi:hypothetical protein